MMYYCIHLVYVYLLEGENKKLFESMVDYCQKQSDFIPLSFLLGFYVSTIMTRWWAQYTSIPWPTSIAVYVSSTLHGHDEVGRAMRRTIMRYVCLCLTMVLRVLSPRVKQRFLKLSDLVEAGLLNENELCIIEDLDKKFPGYSKNWLPIVWAASIVTKARLEGRIRDDFAVKTIIESLNNFRGSCGTVMSYNNISIPLVYTQVVTIAVYSYFLAALMGEQFVDNKPPSLPGGFNINALPIFITLQFLFYMGWLKVAETLMNPFGEDDDDFEVSYMIDRNLQMSYLIVDEMHNEHPELVKDQYWDEIPKRLYDNLIEDPKEREFEKDDTADFEIHNKRMSKKRSILKVDRPSNFGVLNDLLIPDPSVITARKDPKDFENKRERRKSVTIKIDHDEDIKK